MSEIIEPNEEGIKRAAEIIKSGNIVAFPTETVYGLGANGFDSDAVKKIFEAKGRPGDNPLILHIAHKEDFDKIAASYPSYVKVMMEKFWPGPLSMIVPADASVPKAVTAGLDTVAIRMPSLKLARDFIDACGVPIAAPSANISGRPSPTTFDDVYYDLSQKNVPIIKGDDTEIGLESTVVLCTSYPPVILRPGKITREEIAKEVGDCLIDMKTKEKPLSPGQKYGHYMANKPTVLMDIDPKDTDEYLDKLNINGIYILSEQNRKRDNSIVIGDYEKPEEASHRYFHALRDADKMDGDIIIVQAFKKDRIGLALFERMMKSSKHRILEDKDEDWIW